MDAAAGEALHTAQEPKDEREAARHEVGHSGLEGFFGMSHARGFKVKAALISKI